MLPAGLRFYPTEGLLSEELLLFYPLKRFESFDHHRVIPVLNIFEHEPCRLPELSGELCHGDAEQWFFFVPRGEEAGRGGQSPQRKSGSVEARKTELINSSISLEDLLQCSGRKRKDAAESLGVSVSTFKRLCRQHGIKRWQNRIASNVWKTPDPHERNTSPTYKTSSYHGQTEMENQMVGHLHEPNEHLSEYFDGPICWNTESSIPMSIFSHPMPTMPHMMPPLTPSQDTSFVTVKATYGDDIIKFQLPLTYGIIEFKKEVARRLELDSFNLKYKDEDGDWILISCDEDLRNYLQLFSSLVNSVIRLLVVDKVAKHTNL